MCDDTCTVCLRLEEAERLLAEASESLRFQGYGQLPRMIDRFLRSSK
jgi:hypothetical protein